MGDPLKVIGGEMEKRSAGHIRYPLGVSVLDAAVSRCKYGKSAIILRHRTGNAGADT